MIVVMIGYIIGIDLNNAFSFNMSPQDGGALHTPILNGGEKW